MGTLTCKTFEKEIGAFFDDDLDNEELTAFLAHIENCDDCREELTIRLLIRMGLQRLEDGRNFHLGNEFDRMIKNARARLMRRQRLQKLAGLLIGAVALAVVAVIVFTLFILVL
ncbi:MAG: zf-HC2 domain-containing protein [Lachnospiraceae bacterium]|nr:zf-HC2 domain-containing protein [Lachnospiraceae bacterium]